ncbi:uncharacterized protein LOC118439262 [Folsomia candida]|uniref:uncharacterized protein LOC118439262 n=1 Tax=Folsomia candida TaxID=158441 RepID=UPI00160540B7|nr:uncharacterized protein LOC118439262 [Folsomia candida]
MELPHEERSAQQIALNNPIILTEILKKTSAPLLTCRLVSHFWNEVVLSLPNTRLSLNLHHKDERFPNDPVPFLALCFKMEDRLAKRINATCSARSLNHNVFNNSFSAKLIHVCDKFGDLVGVLDISILFEVCLPAIYQILQNCCPNLKRLRISGTFTKSNTSGKQETLQRFPPKEKLTIFTLTSKLVTPFLTLFVEEVVKVSPNLQEVTIPWGFYPNFANSKSLSSLIIALHNVRPLDIARANDQLSNLSRILGQVGDQLVTLSFGCDDDKFNMESAEFDFFNNSAFYLPRRMSKLQNFRNDIVDILECSDYLQNATSLKTLVIGKAFTWSKRLDEILKNIFDTKKIFGNVTSLMIREIHDPAFLDELMTAFPNVEKFDLDTYQRTDWRGGVSGMELGVVLKACVGWKALKHFDIAVPTFPKEIEDVIQTLLDAKELYKGLKTFEIMAHREIVRARLFADEMEQLKQVLVAMDAVEDKVIIDNIYFGEESVKKILNFIRSMDMNMAKFAIFRRGAYKY